MDVSVAGPVELESRYVHGVYASIAAHIGRQRAVQWPRVRTFLLSLPCGAVCADVGA
jgi:alkylated DNA repair protein alkB family protein 8